MKILLMFAAIAAMAATGIQEAGGSSITSTPLDAEHLDEAMMIGGSKSEGRSGRAPRSPGKFLNMILSKFTRRRQLRRQSKPQQQKWRQPMSPKPQQWPMQKNMHQTMCTTCPSCPMTQMCPMQPQTTCNDKELEDLAIQLKEAVATAELLEGAIKSILSSFDLLTEEYDSNTDSSEYIRLSDTPGLGQCYLEELSKSCTVESKEFQCGECDLFGNPLSLCIGGQEKQCAGAGTNVYGGNVQFRRFSRPAPQRPPWSFFTRS